MSPKRSNHCTRRSYATRIAESSHDCLSSSFERIVDLRARRDLGFCAHDARLLDSRPAKAVGPQELALSRFDSLERVAYRSSLTSLRPAMDNQLIKLVNRLQDAFASVGLSGSVIDLPQITVVSCGAELRS